MKLTLQIAFGVLLGSLASTFVVDFWHQYQADKLKAETDKILTEQEVVRQEQAKLIQNILQQGRQANPAAIPPAGFIPDDAQSVLPKP
jgi:hypothetical protein